MTQEQQVTAEHVLKITRDQYGNLAVAMQGNLTISECLFGLEIAKNAIMERAKGIGIARPPTRIELNPKRF